MVIQIEKNIPVNRFLKRSLKHKYPFAELDLWDSFYVELDEQGINVLRVLASNLAAMILLGTFFFRCCEAKICSFIDLLVSKITIY